MNSIFYSTITEINHLRSRAHKAYVALSVLRAFGVAAVVSALWLLVDPSRPVLGLMIGVLTIVMLVSFISVRKNSPVDLKNFLLNLDMTQQNSEHSPFIAIESSQAKTIEDWTPRLARELKRIKALETRRLTAISSSIVVPLLTAFLLWSKVLPSAQGIISEAQSIANYFSPDQTLKILQGSIDTKFNGQYVKLKDSTNKIELLPQNMLRYSINYTQNVKKEEIPFIELRSNKGSGSKQVTSFQLVPHFDIEGKPAGWVLDFSMSESAELFIHAADTTKIATIEVKSPPVPEVKLEVNGRMQEPWGDQNPVPFIIGVKSHHPLKKVFLSIKTSQKQLGENVASIMDENTYSFQQEYSLNLEPYMAEDLMEFEITAVAIDAAQPEPLKGQSNPIVIRAASAYGRYKTTLATLNKIRASIDSAIESRQVIGNDLAQLSDEASRLAETSPFFDALDRSNLARIIGDIQEVVQKSSKENASKLLDISGNLANFLFEHETLDDRERDRDFFIAARTLSRIIEQPKASRPVSVENLVNRINLFLDQRFQRWVKRVERLGAQVKLSHWQKVRDLKPFKHGIQAAREFDDSGDQAESQTQIVKTTNLYKQWIDELEAKEDELRQKQEQEQQKGLANARNELRELQQKQDQISSNLDRASSRSGEDLESKWQSTRPLQNSNSKQASSLLEQLKAMSPNAGERLKGAIDAMDQTVAQGNKKQYVDAETAADIAGRLLRDAEQSAARSQQQQKERGRRKRTTGDEYFGNAVVGGDVETKSEYHVDPKYREEILRDASQSSESASDKILLDNYLRQILR